MNVVESKADRLWNALNTSNGIRYGLTSKQIRTMFRVASPRDLVFRLRRKGKNITTDQYMNEKFVTRTKYFAE